MGTCLILQGNTNLRRELARFVMKAHLRLELIQLARINQTEPGTCSICEGKPNRDGNLLTFWWKTKLSREPAQFVRKTNLCRELAKFMRKPNLRKETWKVCEEKPAWGGNLLNLRWKTKKRTGTCSICEEKPNWAGNLLSLLGKNPTWGGKLARFVRRISVWAGNLFNLRGKNQPELKQICEEKPPWDCLIC
jgi:hypothetical protein